ncbi:MAG: PfkB family carbohydrate kinase, partial [Propionicimonas sp.]|nr:PfkB family carbohydrate kinase [Propionicimonas sp.]
AAGADVVLLDGHHDALATAAARAGGAAGVPVVVDAGSHKPVLDELWPLASDVICSADYADPSGLPPRALLGWGPVLVAVSHGAGPLRWWTAGESGDLQVPKTEAVDTLGAGDVLHGGYAFALAAGRPRLEALAFGAAAASLRVASLGPFAWRAGLAGLRP